MQRESLGMYSSRGCVENRCVRTPARKGPTWSRVTWTAGQGLFCFFSVRPCSIICPFRANGNEAQQIQNKQVDNSSQPGPKPKPQQEHVFSNLPVSGIQGQTEMKHTKFKTNKLTTAACTKHSRKRQDFKKGFLVGWF